MTSKGCALILRMRKGDGGRGHGGPTMGQYQFVFSPLSFFLFFFLEEPQLKESFITRALPGPPLPEWIKVEGHTKSLRVSNPDGRAGGRAGAGKEEGTAVLFGCECGWKRGMGMGRWAHLG